jgi:hypothetical protein
MIDPIELHAWADGEVLQEREAAVRQYLAETPEAKAELQHILIVKALLREKLPPVACEVQWKTCVGRLNEIDRTRRVERLVSGRFAWALSGALFVTIVMAGFLHRSPDSSNIDSVDVARMLGSFSPTSGHKMASPEATREIDELLKEARISVDPNRLQLLFGQYAEWDGRSVRKWVFRDASGNIALFLLKDVLELDGTGQMRRDHSFRLLHVGKSNGIAWTNGSDTFLLVGDRPFEDLATAASSFR